MSNGIRYLSLQCTSWIQGFADATINVILVLPLPLSFCPLSSSICNYPGQIQPCLTALSAASARNCPHSDGPIQSKTTLSLLPRPQPQILFLEHGIAFPGTYPSEMKAVVRRKKLISLWVWVTWAHRMWCFWRLMADTIVRDGKGVCFLHAPSGFPNKLKTRDWYAIPSTSRFLGFLACCAGGIACFGIAFLFLPIRMLSQLQIGYFGRHKHIYWQSIVAIKPRKFALAFTLGSCLFMLGFAILHGPWNRMLLPC